MAGVAGRLPARTAAPIIDTIVVVNQNIFDDNDLEALPYLARIANALHVKTQASVIRRTILFNQGDPYDSARGQRARCAGVRIPAGAWTPSTCATAGAAGATEDGWSTSRSSTTLVWGA